MTSVRLRPIDELVLVDAKLGSVALSFNQVETAKNRSTYTAANGSTLPGTLKCTEASAFPACANGDADVEAAHRIAGQVYDFYASRHGRDSLDGAGEPLISTVHYGHAYDNVFWDPDDEQMVIGDARTYAGADDVIGHELTHAVTQHESGLFYYAQSGAINESLSDIFGEFIDLTDGTGNDDPSVRWLLGEDVQPGGAVRSMINPPAFGQPDRMTSPAYSSSESDSAGVHANSGVGNKAAYLMTDGGTFNGKTVTGLGIDKAEAIYYEAATNLLTSASDYQDLYNALQQACANLVGTHGIVDGGLPAGEERARRRGDERPAAGRTDERGARLHVRLPGGSVLGRPRASVEPQLAHGHEPGPGPVLLSAEPELHPERHDVRDERCDEHLRVRHEHPRTTRTSR